jgi:energy-converting hydrogenase Eha subunit G
MRCIEQCGAMKTYPKVLLHPHRLVLNLRVGGVGVVVKGVGRLSLPGVVKQAREVGLAQRTQDAIDMACETTTRHNGPVPA